MRNKADTLVVIMIICFMICGTAYLGCCLLDAVKNLADYNQMYYTELQSIADEALPGGVPND